MVDSWISRKGAVCVCEGGGRQAEGSSADRKRAARAAPPVRRPLPASVARLHGALQLPVRPFLKRGGKVGRHHVHAQIPHLGPAGGLVEVVPRAHHPALRVRGAHKRAHRARQRAAAAAR
eukprot:361940-Chlamydomonas_euryale.AAC.7